MAFFEQDNQGINLQYQRKLIKDIEMNDEGVYIIGRAENKNPSQEFDLNDETGTVRVRQVPQDIDEIMVGEMYRILGQMSLDGAGTQIGRAHV